MDRHLLVFKQSQQSWFSQCKRMGLTCREARKVVQPRELKAFQARSCVTCLSVCQLLCEVFSLPGQMGQSCEMSISVLGQVGAPRRVALQRVAPPRSLGCICALRNALVKRKICFKMLSKPSRACLRSTFRFLSQASRTRTPLRHAGAYNVSRLPPLRVSCLSGMVTRNPIVEELRITFNLESCRCLRCFLCLVRLEREFV